jgi:hypothetical protein
VLGVLGKMVNEMFFQSNNLVCKLLFYIAPKKL